MDEAPTRIEPCLFGDWIPAELADLAVDLQRAAGGLGATLHPEGAAELADPVRVMNCHYSNLIEGRAARPSEIERALAGAELDEETRPFALEARAHVSAQRRIDEAARLNSLPPPTSPEFLTWTHRMLFGELSAEHRQIELPDGGRAGTVPGRFRGDGDPEVSVGRHRPPSSSRVEACMEHFDRRFRETAKSAANRIIAIPAAHHRLNHIHPFPDGNGRVSRLMSHSMAIQAGIGGRGLWSVSRGLALGLKDPGEYKRMMDHADSPGRGDSDGLGNLSERALLDFSVWFLEIMLDQIAHSARMFDFGGLEERYRRLVAELIPDKRAGALMGAVLRLGSLDRGKAHIVLNTSERTARNTLKALTDAGFLASESPKTPVRAAFPTAHRARLFPGLFTEAVFTR